MDTHTHTHTCTHPAPVQTSACCPQVCDCYEWHVDKARTHTDTHMRAYPGVALDINDAALQRALPLPAGARCACGCALQRFTCMKTACACPWRQQYSAQPTRQPTQKGFFKLVRASVTCTSAAWPARQPCAILPSIPLCILNAHAQCRCMRRSQTLCMLHLLFVSEVSRRSACYTSSLSQRSPVDLSDCG